MTEQERLERLIDELLSDTGYVNGRRRFPRTVTPEDAVTIAGGLQSAVDRETKRRDDEARRRRVTIACQAGCTACCEMPILVFLPEALRVAAWLARPENAAAREAFLAAYPGWKERVGDAPDDVAAEADATRVAAVVRYWEKRVPCAFLQGGLCSIYPVRPNLCRAHHAVDTSDDCLPNRTSRRFDFVPLDRLVERGVHIHLGLHHALGGARQRLLSLCDVVHELLSRPPAPPP